MLAVKNITDPMYAKIPLYNLLERTKEHKDGYKVISTRHEGKLIKIIGKL